MIFLPTPQLYGTIAQLYIEHWWHPSWHKTEHKNHGVTNLTLATYNSPLVIIFFSKFSLTTRKFCPMSQPEFGQNISILLINLHSKQPFLHQHPWLLRTESKAFGAFSAKTRVHIHTLPWFPCSSSSDLLQETWDSH